MHGTHLLEEYKETVDRLVPLSKTSKGVSSTSINSKKPAESSPAANSKSKKNMINRIRKYLFVAFMLICGITIYGYVLISLVKKKENRKTFIERHLKNYIKKIKNKTKTSSSFAMMNYKKKLLAII